MHVDEGMAVSFDAVMDAPGDEDAAERMFELANASRVRFSARKGRELCIRQDPSNSTTGGCVWETAYLLALWAAKQLQPKLDRAGPPLRCLEVGAGCGLLGISLAASGADVLVTETPSAMPNLEHNVANNRPTGRGSLAAAALHWGDAAHLAAVRELGPYDVLLGTDVVYVEAMVRPLLHTLWSCAGSECAAGPRWHEGPPSICLPPH